MATIAMRPSAARLCYRDRSVATPHLSSPGPERSPLPGQLTCCCESELVGRGRSRRLVLPCNANQNEPKPPRSQQPSAKPQSFAPLFHAKPRPSSGAKRARAREKSGRAPWRGQGDSIPRHETEQVVRTCADQAKYSPKNTNPTCAVVRKQT